MPRKTYQEKFEACNEELTFKFINKEAALQFKRWLCGQGEQDYWIWMQEREQEEKGPITGLDFDYWHGSTIKVKCGRMDER